MKRALWLAAMSAVFVLALAGAAYANTFSTFATWSATGANAAVPSPHSGYALTTIKCAVCHAVHKAPTTGQILLALPAANACQYCHIQTNVGNVQLYGGIVNNYNIDYANNHSAMAGCTNCHAVHGAGTIQSSIATITARILKTNAGGYAPQAGTPYTYASATYDNVISNFCTTCHPYWVGAYEGTHLGSMGDATVYKGHILTATINNYSNPNKALGTPAQVAFAGDPYCRSCHDSGNTQEGAGLHSNNFPHYTTGLRFELASTSTVAPDYDATTSPVQDGVCLKCHSNGAQGVNMTF